MFPLVLELADDGILVAMTCRVLGFSKQALRKGRACPVTDREWADLHMINAAIDIHHDDPSSAPASSLTNSTTGGVVAGCKRVNRLCSSPDRHGWLPEA